MAPPRVGHRLLHADSGAAAVIVVLDTNVLVSALLNRRGTPAEVLRLVQRRALQVAHDARILADYREVLLRPRFRFAPAEVAAVVDFLAGTGLPVAPAPLGREAPAPGDVPFLEVAAGVAAPLVTGNKRHYPARVRGGVRVLSPAELLVELRGRI